jgi:hypothetical protein
LRLLLVFVSPVTAATSASRTWVPVEEVVVSQLNVTVLELPAETVMLCGAVTIVDGSVRSLRTTVVVSP